MDYRKEKQFYRKAGMDHPVYLAWLEGQVYAEQGLASMRNRYPPGRRHDEWERGYAAAGQRDQWGFNT